MKVMLFGLDSAIGPRWHHFAETGELPVTKRLMDDGAYAEHCLPPLPTLTPTNWTGLATGAWPGTHGITDFNMHKPGQELNDCPQAFDSTDCLAEHIWNTAARVGKRSILVNYPVTLPPVLANGVTIGGAGCEVTDWRIGLPSEDRTVVLAADQCFSTTGEPLATAVKWPAGQELRLPLEVFDSTEPVTSDVELVASLDSESSSCDIRLSTGESVGRLEVGSWSRTIVQDFRVMGSLVTGAFKVKLMALDSARQEFRLYVTDICSLRGLEHPAGVLGDLAGFEGLPLASVGYNATSLGWVDLDTFVQCLEMTNRWIEDVSKRLLSQEPWDIYYTTFHTIDWLYHLASSKLDPVLTPDGAERAPYEAAELALYRSMDSAIGSILEVVPEDSLKVIVSDHGATSYTRYPPTKQILTEAGLLSTRAEDQNDASQYWKPVQQVDWSATLAVPQRSCWIYVNLKGRDPQGIVDQSDYGRVQERVIDALLSYRDPESGICPYSLVLRKEDARILGLYGDRVGDIVYAVREEFGDEHGQTLPTGQEGATFGSLRSAFLISGPGIKKGAVLSRNVWLTDVVPTICYVARLPMPRDTEGAVLYQALENPNGLLEDWQRAVDSVQKLTNAMQRRQALTHEYR